MSAYPLLFDVGVASFFLCAGAISGALAWLASGSSLTIVIVVLAAILYAALSWLLFAAYTRDIWQLPHVLLMLHVALLRATVAYMLRGFHPVFPEWTFKFEIVRAAMRALRAGVFVDNIVRSRNARYFNWQAEWLGKRAGPKSCQAYGTKMETVVFNGMEHVWIRDNERDRTSTEQKERFVVFYYHGGGFVLLAPPLFVDLGNRVRRAIMKSIHEEYPKMKNVSVEIFLANYRKGPDFKYPVPQEDALLAFEHLVAAENLDPSRIVLMGDSAGGGLCISTMLRLKAKGARLPGGTMLLCPFVDFATDSPADDTYCMFPRELGEAMIRAFLPAPNDPTTWGDAAAVSCDLTGLPPALVQVGSADTIYNSVCKLYEKAQADGLGASWELDVFPRMPHDFTVLPDVLLPDAKRGIEHVATFIVRQFNRAITK